MLGGYRVCQTYREAVVGSVRCTYTGVVEYTVGMVLHVDHLDSPGGLEFAVLMVAERGVACYLYQGGQHCHLAVPMAEEEVLLFAGEPPLVLFDLFTVWCRIYEC